ncbi:MAG: hypothetical protein IT303_00765 [Dehalococcoidia bacterium]|nr:hypothetical protein [Dehalococcoidia bacterium]
MTRRSSQLPWSGRSTGNLYGGPRHSGIGRPVALGLIVLGVVALLVFLFMRMCGGESCTEEYCASGTAVAPPEGYELVTKVYEYQRDEPIPAGNSFTISLELTKELEDSRNLSFYQYLPETEVWEPLAPATLEGEHAVGSLASSPLQIAVLRRLSQAGHVVAYLPNGGTLHPSAMGKITILHTRDFKPAADGAIEGTRSQVQVDKSVAWYPVISADARDQSAIPIVNGILSSAGSRSNHVQQIMKLVTENQFAGIDIAYLDLQPGDRTGFTLFAIDLANALHAQGKILTLTLPAPVKAQDRIDEGAYDWAQLGKAADVVKINPYRDQSTYRQVMPEVLEYLRSVVEPTKLVLTVSPYATEKAVDGIRTMSLTEAMVIATSLGLRAGADGKVMTSSNITIVATNIDRDENLSGVKWSPETASVFFTYKLQTGRTVWIENFYSIGFKLEFISRYGLGGVGVEDASGNETLGNIWTALDPFITSGQPVLMQPNPQDLEPQWAVSAGTAEGGADGSMDWATPAQPGTYTVTLTLSDGVALFENQIPVDVQARPAATATATPGTG